MSDPLAGLKADLKATSSQISSQVRTLALSTLAFVWLFLIQSKELPEAMIGAMPRYQLLIVALLSILALAVDLLQYVAGYVNTHRVLLDSEANEKEPSFDPKAFLYVARTWCFWVKILFGSAAVVMLLALIVRAILIV